MPEARFNPSPVTTRVATPEARAPRKLESAAEGADALSFLTKLAADLSRGPVDLPCFPNVVVKIRDALNDPRTTAEETVRLVGSEPRFAARLIQLANSAAFNPSGKPVADLRTAITRLGIQLVQGAAMSFAVQQMKDEPKLRSIARPLGDLWRRSITVASLCQVVARGTKVPSDQAFLAGLLHGIGRLYIMVHAADKPGVLNRDLVGGDLVMGWHPSIGKAVLENWAVGDAIAESVNDQLDLERPLRREAELTDILIVSIILADALVRQGPKVVEMAGIQSFRTLKLTAADCNTTLKHAGYQLGSLLDALGC